MVIVLLFYGYCMAGVCLLYGCCMAVVWLLHGYCMAALASCSRELFSRPALASCFRDLLSRAVFASCSHELLSRAAPASCSRELLSRAALANFVCFYFGGTDAPPVFVSGRRRFVFCGGNGARSMSLVVVALIFFEGTDAPSMCLVVSIFMFWRTCCNIGDSGRAKFPGMVFLKGWQRFSVCAS